MKSDNLKENILGLIAKASFELGFKTDAETMAGLSVILTEDLLNERRFKNLEFADIEVAFRLGVRNGGDNFINIPTFYKWIKEHKNRIAEEKYKHHTLNCPTKDLIYYKPQKLLK
tara:strand:- start:2362 stop:2706 length:345 start_codon:yes stop_codon:yes gene_type:complete